MVIFYRSNRLQFFLISFFAFADVTVTESFLYHRRGSCDRMPTITTTIGSSPTSVLALPAGCDDRFNLGGEKKESSTSFFETSGHEHEIEHEIETKRKKAMEAAPLDPRSCILGVGASAGKLCWVANQMVPERDDESGELSSSSPSQLMSQDELLTEALAELFASLWLTAKALRLDWVKSIRSKMALNAKKYPVEHCKVRTIHYVCCHRASPQNTTPAVVRASARTIDTIATANYNYNDSLQPTWR